MVRYVKLRSNRAHSGSTYGGRSDAFPICRIVVSLINASAKFKDVSTRLVQRAVLFHCYRLDHGWYTCVNRVEIASLVGHFGYYRINSLAVLVNYSQRIRADPQRSPTQRTSSPNTDSTATTTVSRCDHAVCSKQRHMPQSVCLISHNVQL